MHKLPLFPSPRFILLAAVCLPVHALDAQQQQPIGHTSATEVEVSGAVDVDHGEMLLGNGSTITAANQAVKIALTRGGHLLLCSTTSLHLAKDRSITDPGSTALMMALDRGALEADYTVGKYSDVLLTPDLRILISGPGEAELSIRVNSQGDTCVDNHGVNAPYVTVSSQLEGGVYRVMPNQRVTFEHGSLTEMVDHEPEPCGCPATPPIAVATAGASSKNPAKPGVPIGGPSSTREDTAFPLAESEGLAAPPAVSSKPVVPVGQAHAQVTVPLTYSGEHPPAIPPVNAAASGIRDSSLPTMPALAVKKAPMPDLASPAVESMLPASVSETPAETQRQHGFLRSIGHFFSRLFRA